MYVYMNMSTLDLEADAIISTALFLALPVFRLVESV